MHCLESNTPDLPPDFMSVVRSLSQHQLSCLLFVLLVHGKLKGIDVAAYLQLLLVVEVHCFP
jgi:hypothetical protein